MRSMTERGEVVAFAKQMAEGLSSLGQPLSQPYG